VDKYGQSDTAKGDPRDGEKNQVPHPEAPVVGLLTRGEPPARPARAAGVAERWDDPRGTDAELIAQSVADAALFAAVFDRHADEILRYVIARLGPDLAEDVTAETFLAAFRCRGRYDPARPDARPWLYGIATRQIGAHRRAEARYRRLLALTPPEAPAEDFGDRSAERVTAQRLRPQLIAVLDGLRRRDRELLLLVAWEGLSYEESAAALGITVSAVKSRLNRIRRRTRAALGGSNPMDQENGNGNKESGSG
jgi:RNA polymerase sigma factor (sigma-70 family)